MKPRNPTIGFFVALAFAAANLYSYFHMPEYSTIDDGFVYFGWPFAVYVYGGYCGHAVIIWTGLIGDVFVALCVGRVLGRTLEKILTRLAARSHQMAIPRLLTKFLKLIGLMALGFVFFAANLIVLWNFSGIRHKVKIENGSTAPVFQVVVMESGKPELFLLKEELDDYLRTHSNYSFLIPAGQDQLVQDQIVASYNAKFGIHGGKGYPTFKRQVLDANHQYIELYMHGDPHDDVFWYEARDKTIEPSYYMVFGAFQLLFMVAVAIGMTAVEYAIGVRLVRKEDRALFCQRLAGGRGE